MKMATLRAMLFLALGGNAPVVAATLTGTAAGRPLSISTRSRTATAIHSLVWNGVEFIDDYDHGRQLQSASNHGVQGHEFCPEGHNPTEGGSGDDDAGPTSTSRVLSERVEGNQLITSARLAYWQRAGQTNRFGCTAYGVDTPLSDHILDKTVTLGVETPNAGFVDNLLRFETTFTVDPDIDYFVHQFEALTGYMPTRFSEFKTWNPVTKQFSPLSRGPGEQALPVVLHTADEQFAMGIFSFEDQGTYPTGYGRWAFPSANASSGIGTNKWNVVYRVGDLDGGPTLTQRKFSYTQYVAIGTLEDVGNAFGALVVPVTSGCQTAGDRNEAPGEKPPGVARWWPGDGTLEERATGSAVSVQGRVGFASGIVGDAFQFGGDANPGSFVGPLPGLAREFTLEAWVNHVSVDPVIQRYVTLGGGGADSAIRLQGSRIHFFAFTTDGFKELFGRLPALNRWVLVDGVFNGRAGSMELYVDGALASSIALPPGTQLARIDNRMPLASSAAVVSAFRESMSGLIDEAAIFRRALQASEVQSVFDAACGPPEAEISVVPRTLDFGRVILEEDRTLSVAVLSAGELPLTLSRVGLSESTDEAFVVSKRPNETTLVPGAEEIVEVTYAPLGPGSHAGTLVLRSDAIDNPIVEVSLSGVASHRWFLRADANGDRQVDISDAFRVVLFLFSGGEIKCMDAADADDDSRVLLNDPIWILNYLLRDGPPPPAPFPGCAADASEDALGCSVYEPCV